MSAFWRLLTGTDRSRPRRASRPGTAHRPEVSGLEVRRLNAVTMGVLVPPKGGPAIPPVAVAPKFLFPSDGRYAPVRVSGGVSSTYTMSFEGAYTIFPKPALTSRTVAQVPLPDPTSTTTPPVTTPVSGTFTAIVAGSKTPVTIPYTLISFTPPTITPGALPTITPGTDLGVFTVTLPGTHYPTEFGFVWQGSVTTTPGGYVISPNGIYQVVGKDLPVSDYENQVIATRLNSRKGPGDVVLQTTDQYRQDEPHVIAPLTLLGPPSVEPFGAAVYVFANAKQGVKYTEQVSVPTTYAINRYFSYGFTIYLQAKKNAGTGGRQYILNVSSEDADDGGSTNTAVIVPNSA